MRPLLIEMSGFGAFKDPTTIDLADAEFFVLVGPTGAGKSTVVDAVCFALYGCVPRYEDKRLVGSAMSLGRLEARVALTFALGETEYLALRIVRRTKDGKVTTKEARLARADGTLLAGRASDMDAAVEQLLGLSFEHFTRSVVLPQGEFARFLHDKASDRQDLLVSLLDLDVYERMAAAARRRAEQAETTIEFARRRLDGLAEMTDEARAAAVERAGALEDLVAELDAVEPDRAALEAARAEHEARARSARELAAELAALAVPPAVLAHGHEHADATRRLDGARRARDRAAADLAAAVAARTEGPSRAPLQRALDDYAEAGRVAESLAAAEARVAESEARRAATATAREQADVAVATATAAVEAARQASAAHAVAEALVIGEPCPACGQLVRKLPHRRAPRAWQEARRELDAAAARLKEAVRAERDITAAHARAVADRDVLAGRRAELETILAAGPSQAEATAALERLDALDAAEGAARATDEQAAAVVRAAEAGLAALDAARADATDEYHRSRDRFVPYGAPAPGADVVASWKALVAWGAEEAPRRSGAAAAAAAEAAAAGEALAAIDRALAERFTALGLAAAPSTRRAVLADALAATRQRVVTLDEGLVERARLTAEVDARREEATVGREMARLLSARGFERWLVAEALTTLVVAASGTLRQLSGDQYSLAIDDTGEFVVIDHANGDERRGVRTLSGGETFQASLALALALADHLANASPAGPAKLDAIFLDEGFGTLDPDSLDTVADTIEALAAGGGRTVGIVTHVRELAERVPVRFEVTKGPRTSRIERVER